MLDVLLDDTNPIELLERVLDLLIQDQQFGTPKENLELRKAIVGFLEATASNR